MAFVLIRTRLEGGRRVHSRAACANTAHASDGRVDVEVRRLPVTDQQRGPFISGPRCGVA